MRMCRTLPFGALLLLVSAAAAAAAQNKPVDGKVPAPQTGSASGKQTYMHYCASCHGADALGAMDRPRSYSRRHHLT